MFAFAGAFPSCFDRIADANFLHNACHPPSDDDPGKDSYNIPKPGIRKNSVKKP